MRPALLKVTTQDACCATCMATMFQSAIKRPRQLRPQLARGLDAVTPSNPQGRWATCSQVGARRRPRIGQAVWERWAQSSAVPPHAGQECEVEAMRLLLQELHDRPTTTTDVAISRACLLKSPRKHAVGSMTPSQRIHPGASAQDPLELRGGKTHHLCP